MTFQLESRKLLVGFAVLDASMLYTLSKKL